MNESSQGQYSREQLIGLLSPSLGLERSREVVELTQVQLRLPSQGMSREQAEAVLTSLGQTPGLVGIVARLALAQLKTQAASETARMASARPRTR